MIPPELITGGVPLELTGMASRRKTPPSETYTLPEGSTAIPAMLVKVA